MAYFIMSLNKNKEKEFLDVVKSQDPDRIGKILSEMSDSEFDRASRDLWENPENKIEDCEIESAFRSFRLRTGCFYSISSSTIRLLLSGSVAVVVAIIGFLAGISYISKHQEENVKIIAWTEVCTDYGEISELILPDSSRVWINSGSRILYPEEFIGYERKIYLSGEIYIEVEKDPLHPFIVNAGGTEIRVTGTKFNVKAYQEDGTVTTTLMEGGVTVGIPGCDTVALLPGKSLLYDRIKEELDMFQVNLDSYPAWFKGEFNAYHMTLSQIAKDLERRFGVKIVIKDPEIAEEIYYASFVRGEDADRILSALNIDGNYNVKREGNYIEIYK